MTCREIAQRQNIHANQCLFVITIHNIQGNVKCLWYDWKHKFDG